MNTIEACSIPAAMAPVDLWPMVARQSLAWLARSGVAVRDAVLVLPFAELLTPCRRALAAEGGWMPRVETWRTLAASLGPAETALGDAGHAEAPSGDRAVDALLAERWLATLPGLRDWRRRDPAAHAQAIADLVDTTHALMRSAATRPPCERSARLADAAQALPGLDGPGAARNGRGPPTPSWGPGT